MKKAFLLVTLCLSSMAVFSQSPLEKGNLQLNLGLGTSGWGVPVYAGLDYGLGNEFTLGGEISYQSHNYGTIPTGYGQFTTLKASIFGIGLNGNYHFNKVLDISSEWDLYAGLNLSYFVWNYNYTGITYSDGGTSGINLGAQIGARYFFTDKFGINLELGAGSSVSAGKIGITFKL